MTFQYNGTVIARNVPDGPSADMEMRKPPKWLGQQSVRILVGAIIAGLVIYCFWTRVALNRVLCYSGLFFAQSIAGEYLRGRAVRRGAVVERGSPFGVWLRHFVTVELLAILLSFAEVFLVVALGAAGVGIGS